jgi:hypothetical protein
MWEYKVDISDINEKGKKKGVITASFDEEYMAQVLNEFGRQNWELVSFVINSITEKAIAIFKRPLK